MLEIELRFTLRIESRATAYLFIFRFPTREQGVRILSYSSSGNSEAPILGGYM